MKEVIKGWVARDEDGTLYFHMKCPNRKVYEHINYWISNSDVFELDSDLFYDVEWTDGPLKATMTINIDDD